MVIPILLVRDIYETEDLVDFTASIIAIGKKSCYGSSY